MKTKKVNSIIYPFVFIGLLLFGFSACKKDNDTKPKTLKEQLVGKWNITSFKLGDNEYIGTLVDSASIQYDSFTGTQGNFKQNVVFSDNTEVTTSGKYTVNESTKEVKMLTIDDEITAKITVNGDKFDWLGEQDGETLIIKANRK